MLSKIKSHFNKTYNLVFWLLFGPAMAWTIYGVVELYTTYIDLLTREDHMQFFLRFLFPISLATLVTVLDIRARKQRDKITEGIKDYLNRDRSTK